jgi:hypothetical protein
MQRERTQGDYWAGPNTDPNDCCTVVIPSGATLENEAPNNPEADCATDIFNGGCNMASPLFSTITCGQTIYGESGTFGQGERDTDWYRVTITAPRIFTVTVRAEFDVRIRAYREGCDHNNPCVGYEEVATPAEPAVGTHNKCTDVVLATRCLPGGAPPGQPEAPAYYYFVVEPALSSGLRCRSDYKINVICTVCEPCGAPCPDGSYLEGDHYPTPPDPGYCMADPNDLSFDPENGGCNDPNETFEPLPYDPADPNCTGECTFSFCGKLWAKYPYRDVDWYKIDLLPNSQVAWSVLSEVPCRATLLFNNVGGGVYGPLVDCNSPAYYWVETLVPACVQTTWNQPTLLYDAGTYWFYLYSATGDPAAETPIFNGYPCPMCGVELGNDYQVTMTVTPKNCENEILLMPVGHIEDPNNPPCPTPTNWVDTYNSGCDAAVPPGPMQTIAINPSGGFDPNTAWRGRIGTWYTDPNDPNSLKHDYDWYKFTLTNQKRFMVQLYADFKATWEIWDPNDPNGPTGSGCIKGPAEGLDLEPCHLAGEWTRRCYYPGGDPNHPREYWLRVFPTSRTGCGKYYYLALRDSSTCSLCGGAAGWSCVGQNLDDNCDDQYDTDTNYGCDDPNATPMFMTFNFGTTYCGRIYAGLQNGAPYYDPDWFQITQTNALTRKFRFTLTTEFLAHLEIYGSCTDYNSGNPLEPGTNVYTALNGSTVCPNAVLTTTTNYPQGTTVYGRITCVDQLHNLLTKYYPCAKGWNRWRMTPTAVAF